jgi:cysteine desulfurase
LALPGLSAETLVIALDLKGISASAGAACSSGKVGASHVLEAMGLEPQVARAAIRVSLGPQSTDADVAAFLDAWADIVVRRRERAVA